MLDQVFGSKARIKVLALFVLNPEDRFYVRQVAAKTDLPYTAVRRELQKLKSFGLLREEESGIRKYYVVNKNFFLYPEFKNIILKTVGLGAQLKDNLVSTAEIDIAFIYGSYAKDEETTTSDIDLFVVGSISSRHLHDIIAPVEEETGREVNYSLFSKYELRNRFTHGDHFIISVVESPRIFLKGDEDDLRGIVEA